MTEVTIVSSMLTFNTRYYSYIQYFSGDVCTIEYLSFITLVTPGNVNVTVDNIASQGENVAFTCTSSGGPDNSYEWLMDNRKIENETSNSLMLLEVNSSDGGIYTCLVSNPAGNSTSSVTLYIEPYITTVPSEGERVEQGDAVTFYCDAEGFPAPNITWWKVDMNKITLASENGTLKFSSVTYDDFGTYQCLASAVTPDGMQLEEASPPLSVLTGVFHRSLILP